jgi:hypothetical protein
LAHLWSLRIQIEFAFGQQLFAHNYDVIRRIDPELYHARLHRDNLDPNIVADANYFV